MTEISSVIIDQVNIERICTFCQLLLVHNIDIVMDSAFLFAALPGLTVKGKTALTPGNSLTNADTPLLSFPLSYIRSGMFNYLVSTLDKASRIDILSNYAPSYSAIAEHFYATDTSINVHQTSSKGGGRSLRYAARPNKEEPSLTAWISWRDYLHHRLQPHERRHAITFFSVIVYKKRKL